MKQTKIFRKVLILFMFVSLLVQISACGWILHPERRGQNGGRIDVGIAVLDGVGLLFFLIPGIIAFAVDFSSGCIYLPGGRYSGASDTDGIDTDGIDADEIKVVHVDPAKLNETMIKKIIIRETGISAMIDLNQAEFCALNGSWNIPGKFTEMKKSGYQSRASIASNSKMNVCHTSCPLPEPTLKENS